MCLGEINALRVDHQSFKDRISDLSFLCICVCVLLVAMSDQNSYFIT